MLLFTVVSPCPDWRSFSANSPHFFQGWGNCDHCLATLQGLKRFGEAAFDIPAHEMLSYQGLSSQTHFSCFISNSLYYLLAQRVLISLWWGKLILKIFFSNSFSGLYLSHGIKRTKQKYDEINFFFCRANPFRAKCLVTPLERCLREQRVKRDIKVE